MNKLLSLRLLGIIFTSFTLLNCSGKTYDLLLKAVTGGSTSTSVADNTDYVLVESATALTPTQVRLVFDEPVTLSLAESTTNYSINNGLNVLSVQRDPGDSRVVLISTSLQSGGSTYTITVQNVTGLDGSSLSPSQFTASFTAASSTDTTPPVANTATATAIRTIEVSFNEAVSVTQNTANYTVHNSADCSGGAIGLDSSVRDNSNFSVVRLTTTNDLNTSTYSVEIQPGIEDTWGNAITSPPPALVCIPFNGFNPPTPVVAGATLTSATSAVVTYSEAMLNDADITNTANYTINNCQGGGSLNFAGATISVSSPTSVLITGLATAGTVNDGQCVLTVSSGTGIESSQNAPISTTLTDRQALVNYSSADSTAPVITSAIPQDNTTVRVTFNEPINNATVAASDFTFSGGLTADSVTCGPGPATYTYCDVTTSAQATTGYNLTVSGITDSSGNNITSSSTSFTGDGVPEVTSIIVGDNGTIYLVLSEPVQGGIDTSDFSIAPALNVTGASFDPSSPSNVIQITTDPMTGGTDYTLSINAPTGITDSNGNELGSTISSPTFSGDGRPTVTSATSPSPSSILVNFSEPLVNGSIGTGDFAISGACDASSDTTVTSATQTSPGTVLLILGSVADEIDGNCTVTVTGVNDLNGNSIDTGANTAVYAYTSSGTGDFTAPTVLSANSTSNTEVVVYFSEPVATGSTTSSNYSFSPSLTPGAVSCNASGACTIATSSQSVTSYTVTVENVEDSAGNTISGSNTATFTGTAPAGSAPSVFYASLVNNVTLEVVFSESVDLATSQTVTHYTISPGTYTYDTATRQADNSIVWLTFSPGAYGSTTEYELTVNFVEDLEGNSITPVIPPNTNVATFFGIDTSSNPAPDLVAADDSGSSDSDNITSVTNNLTFTGTVGAGDDVTIYDDGVAVAITTADLSGNYSIDIATLATGSNTITITTTDSAGNVSQASAPLVVTVDTAPPGAPAAAPDLAAADDNGASDSDNITNLTTGLTFTGSAEANATVTVYNGGTAIGTTTADGSGNYSIDIDIAAGAHSLTVRATDAAGNEGADSPALVLNIDDSAPATPGAAPDLAAADDSGSSDSDNVTSNTSNLTFTGTVEANAIVEIFSGSTSLGTTTADGGGNYTIDVSLTEADSPHSITVVATDSAGNASSASPAITVSVDETAPSTPGSAPALAAADDTGSSNSDGITSNTSNLTFTGTVEPGATVNIYNGGPSLGSTTADGSGNYSIDISLAEAGSPHSITVTATDAAGNTSAASAAAPITIDESAPNQPAALDLTAADDSGVSNSDDRTNQTSGITISGTAEANTTIEVFDGAVSQGTTTADGAGNWSLDVTMTGDGAHSFTATATDSAGNAGAASGALAITLDTSAPDDTSSTVAGGNNYIDITFNEAVYGSDSSADPVEAGDFMIAFNQNGGTATGVTIASVTNTSGGALTGGETTIRVVLNLTGTANGAEDITVSAQTDMIFDSAGNASTMNTGVKTLNASGVADITGGTLDSNNAFVLINFDEGAYSNNDGTGALVAADFETGFNQNSGNATAVTVACVTDTASATCPGSAPAAGATSVRVHLSITGTPSGVEQITISPADGSSIYSSTFQATGDGQNPGTMTLNDKLAPAAPTGLDLAAADDSGPSDSDNYTSVTSNLTITGSAENGSTVELFRDATSLGTTTASGGTFTFNISLAAGSTYAMTATATDAASNTSAASTALNITIDTTTPSAPAVTDLAAADDTGTSDSDNITSNTSNLTFSGTVEANATVTIYKGGSSIGTTTANGAGAYSIDVSISAGSHNITVTQTDLAGQTSSASGVLALMIDTTAPSTPGAAPDLADADDSGSSNSDNLTNQTTNLTFTGTVGANEVVNFYNGGSLIGSTTANGAGAYSIDLSIGAGSHSITSRAQDTAGNESTDSPALSLNIDTSAPSVPAAAPDLAAADDTGSSDSDNITSATSNLTFSGTVGANETVNIYNGGSLIGTTTANGAGAYSIDISIAAGSHSITARAQDAAGNESADSSALSLTIDTSAPSAPAAAPDLAAADDTGSSNSDNITSTTTNLTFSGTVGANETVNIYNGGSLIGTTTANGAGAYSVDISIGAGSHSITARAQDAAGNESGDSSALSLTIDTSAPSAPAAAPDLADADDSGSSNSDNITSNTTNLTFTGTVGANDIVNFYNGGSLIGSTTANGAGAYTIDLSIGAGSHSITARTADTAGNESADSPALSLNIDTSAPSVPAAAPDLAAADDTGSSDSDNITSATTNLTFSGTVGANETVNIYNGGSLIGTTTANGAGAYSIDISIAAGSHSITARAQDAAGNESADSSALSLTIDTSAPSAPAAAPDLAAADDTGSSNSDNITSTTTNLTFSGTVGANETVNIYNGGSLIGTTTANGAGAYSVDISIAAGSHSITARAQDAAGNESGDSSALSLTIDNSLPATPSAPDLAAADDTGSSDSDNITSNTSNLTFSGTVEADATVEIFVDGGSQGTTTASGSGAYNIDIGLAAGSTYSITVTATDAAGNTSLTSAATSVTVDNVAPGIPAGLDLAAADDSGISNTDNRTNATSNVTISGTADANAIIEVFDNAASKGTTTADGGGNWSINITLTGGDGAHNITATAADPAGNTSAATGALALTLDTSAADDTGSTVATVNSYIDISFDQGIYGGAGTSTTPIDTSDISLAFNQNGGVATNVTISSVKQNDSATEGSATNLAGGETTIRVFLTVTGVPDGNEQITISAVASSVYDNSGNVSSFTTGAVNLNPAGIATIVSGSLASNNTYVDVTFDENAYTNTGSTGNLVAGDFNLAFTQNGGSATGASITGVTVQTANTVWRLSLSITGTPSGTETIEITPNSNQVFSATDIATPTSETTGTLTLNDQQAPTISSAETLDSDHNGKTDHYRITFNENVDDSTFPGYALNSEGTITPIWAVSGYGSVRMAHGTAAPESDTTDDNIIYIKFNEAAASCSNTTQVGCDTGAKPDLTTSASPALTDTGGNTVAQVLTGTVTEADRAQPVIKDLDSANSTTIEIFFSEDIDQTTAETAGNYSITGGLTITAAVRDGTDNKKVTLTTNTAMTTTTSYTVTVATAVVDLANNAVYSGGGANAVTFTYYDLPQVSSAAPQNASTVRVTFNETMVASTAQCTDASSCSAIYTIPGLPVTAAVSTAGSGVNSATFDLTVAAQVEGQNYTLTVTSGTAQAVTSGKRIGATNNTANFTGDGQPTAVVSTDTDADCQANSNSRVVVEFDQAVGASALTTGNYTITACISNDCASGTGSPNDAGASSVTLKSGNKYNVDFTDSFDTDGSQYRLNVANVQDSNGNAIPVPTNLSFQCGTDNVPPVLTSAIVLDRTASNTTLLLTFSENLDQTTAETTGNYQVDGGGYGTNITSATRQSNQAQVQVVITPTVAVGAHNVRVQNVQDQNSNAIVDNGTTNLQPFSVSPPTGFDGGPIFEDPFGDDTPSGQLVLYDGKLYMGPNKDSQVLFETDLGLVNWQTILLDADGTVGLPYTDFDGYASTHSGTTAGIDQLYAACIGGTATPTLTGSACTSAGGTENFFIGSLNTTGNFISFWQSTDKSSSATEFTFNEGQNPDPGGGYAYRSTVFIVFKEQLWNHYGAEAGGGGRGGRICVKTGGCDDGTAYFAGIRQRPMVFTRVGAQSGTPLVNGSDTTDADSRYLNAINLAYEFDSDGSGGSNESQLYFANGGKYSGTLGSARSGKSDGGIVRTKLAFSTKSSLPPDCSGWTGDCDTYWEDLTPDANTKWNSYISIPLPENSAITGAGNCGTGLIEMDCVQPYNKFVPSMLAIPYMRTAPNGDLYMLRNACKVSDVCTNADEYGVGCDFRTEKQVCPKGQEVVQIWMLPAVSSGSTPSGATDWVMVAESSEGTSTGQTNMAGNTGTCGTSPNKCLENSHFTMLEFVGDHMYIGFDNDQYGANVWRADVSGVASGSAPVESDFSVVNILGIDGGATNERIFSSVTINDAGKDWLVLVTRDGSNAMRVYRTANDEDL